MQKVNDNHKKISITVLVSLLVVIVVLIVVNVAIGIKQNGNTDDGADSDCLKLKSEEEVLDCIDEEAFSRYETVGCEEALKVYDEVPEGLFDDAWLELVYDNAYSLSLSCNESLQEYWSVKFSNVAARTEARN